MESDIQKLFRIGNVEEIKERIQENPNIVNLIDNKFNWTPLYRSVLCEHYEVVKLLLKSGADPNVQNRLGETPLVQAIDSGNLEISKKLLKYGADIDLPTKEGQTPLHYAVLKGDYRSVELLLQYNANLDWQNILFLKTPLHYAIDYSQVKIAKALVQHGADTDIQDSNGRTAIELASTEGLKNILVQHLNRVSEAQSLEEDNDDSSWDLDGKIKEMVDMNNKIKDTVNQSIDHIRSLDFTRNTSNRKSYRSMTSPTPNSTRLDPLLAWLTRIKLENCHGILVEAGFDETSNLLEALQNGEMNCEFLQSIGISKPGYRVRLLAWLEEEINMMKPMKSMTISMEMKEHNFLMWCVSPKDNASLKNSPRTENLRDWLANLKLEHLHAKFIASGYDDLAALMFLMTSAYPVTDIVLRDEVGIGKPGHRHRIVMRLQQQVEGKMMKSTMVQESEDAKCIIM